MADEKAKPVTVHQYMRALPGTDERTRQYVRAILASAKNEGLDDKAALRIAIAFLEAYRPRDHAAARELAQKLGLI